MTRPPVSLRRTYAGVSIATRLAVSLGAITLIVFALAGVLLDVALMRQLADEERAEALGRLAMARHFIHTRASSIEGLVHELDDMLASHPELRVWAIGDDGRSVYGGLPPEIVAATGDLLTLRSEGGAEWKGLEERLPASSSLPGTRLIVGIDASPRDRLMQAHRLTLALVTLLATALAAALAVRASRRGLAPVAELSRHAARITPDAMSERLPAGRTPPELRELAEAFNRVLDRLERAYAQLDAFNADVAHELRTPLATLINGSQVALSAPRSAEELREVLTSNLEELDDLKRLVNDMLFLARADRGEVPDEMAPLALAGDARDVADYFEATLHENDLRVTIDGDATVRADRRLVRRALSNLLSNAVRYTPRGQLIRVRIRTDRDGASVSVVNPGPTIDASVLPRIFDRFYRAGESSRRSEGQGLGLAIVRAIARMHGGDTFARSAGGETEIGLTLPASSVERTGAVTTGASPRNAYAPPS